MIFIISVLLACIFAPSNVTALISNNAVFAGLLVLMFGAFARDYFWYMANEERISRWLAPNRKNTNTLY